MKIYHNPRCRKSRETLALLEAKGHSPTVVLYLKQTLSKEGLKEILSLLEIPAHQLIRKGETIFKELYKGQTLSEEEWLEAMIEHPKLIERPIVINGDKAAIGRPPERVLAIL